MDSKFYEKEVQCPICKNKFKVTKLKSDAFRAVSRDEDFCTHYEPINPLLYSAWICPGCGYAAMEDRFDKIDELGAHAIKNGLKMKWTPRTLPKERTIDDAIEVFKIALLNLQLRKARSLEVAKVCLRIAWLYRIQENSKENDFLKFALDSYNDIYENEKLPVDGMDEITCMYMIGELNRRLGNLNEAAKWFMRVVSLKSDDKRVKGTIDMARELLQGIREQSKSS